MIRWCTSLLRCYCCCCCCCRGFVWYFIRRSRRVAQLLQRSEDPPHTRCTHSIWTERSVRHTSKSVSFDRVLIKFYAEHSDLWRTDLRRFVFAARRETFAEHWRWSRSHELFMETCMHLNTSDVVWIMYFSYSPVTTIANHERAMHLNSMDVVLVIAISCCPQLITFIALYSYGSLAANHRGWQKPTNTIFGQSTRNRHVISARQPTACFLWHYSRQTHLCADQHQNQPSSST